MDAGPISPIIRAENLGKDYKVAKREGSFLRYLFARSYSTVEAVRGISFSIDRGEMVAFVGPNGAGKSTAIKMLVGILAPSLGSVKVFGRDPFVSRRKNAFLLGVVFGQRSQLWWDLPIGDTFALLKKIYKVENATYEKNIALFQEYLGTAEFWGQPVRQLSLGQRMRAEIAAALLHEPQLLLLDEPTIGLDVVAKRQIREFIKLLNKEKQCTVLLTTHDMRDVEEICERIIIIDHGKLLSDSPMAELKSKYNQNCVLEVSFERPPKPFARSAFFSAGQIKVSSLDELRWKLEFERRNFSVGRVLEELAGCGPLSDIAVGEEPIEDIICDIYTGSEG